MSVMLWARCDSYSEKWTTAVGSERNMKKAMDENDMPTEIDFSNAVRGKYAGRISQGTTMILLAPDVAEEFPDSEAVNAALRMVLRNGLQDGTS
jgi:hypothetical protein